MKSICLTIATLISISIISQNLIVPPSINTGNYSLHNNAIPYRQLISDGTQYYNQDSSLWNTMGYKVFSRMNQFWGDRASGNNDSLGGTSFVEKASINLLQSTINCDLNQTNIPNWVSLGPDEWADQNLGIIISLAIDPLDNTHNTIYAGTNASGLWKTTNGMSAKPIWTCITETTNLPALGVQDILIDPSNSNIIYIATGVSTYERSYGLGILKSVDGGQTWEIVYGIGASEEKIVWKMLMDPSDANVIYAAANNNLIRTMDGGLSWTTIHTLNPSLWRNYIVDIEFDLMDLSYNTVYFTTNTYGAAIATFYKLLNTKSANPIQDLTITQPSNSISGIYKIAVTPAAPQNLYLMNGTVYVSSDGGVTWKNANFPNSGPSQAFDWFNQAFEVSLRDGNIFYVGNTTTWKADLNVSQSFNQITNYGGIINGGDRMHPDIRKIMLLNSGNGEDFVFLGTDGGVSFSDNSGVKFKNINGKGLQITQFYKLGGAEKYPGLILGGCQDVGTKKYENGIWSNIGSFINGDGYECLVDGNNPNIYYYIVNNSVLKSGSNVFSASSSGYTGANMTFHGNNYNAITYSKKDVYENLNQATGPWTKQTNETNSGMTISTVAVSKSNPLVKY